MKQSHVKLAAGWLPLEAFEVGDSVRTRDSQHNVQGLCGDGAPRGAETRGPRIGPGGCRSGLAPQSRCGVWAGSVRPVRAGWEWEFEVEKGHQGTIPGSLPWGWRRRRGSQEPVLAAAGQDRPAWVAVPPPTISRAQCFGQCVGT